MIFSRTYKPPQTKIRESILQTVLIKRKNLFSLQARLTSQKRGKYLDFIQAFIVGAYAAFRHVERSKTYPTSPSLRDTSPASGEARSGRNIL